MALRQARGEVPLQMERKRIHDLNPSLENALCHPLVSSPLNQQQQVERMVTNFMEMHFSQSKPITVLLSERHSLGISQRTRETACYVNVQVTLGHIKRVLTQDASSFYSSSELAQRC